MCLMFNYHRQFFINLISIIILFGLVRRIISDQQQPSLLTTISDNSDDKNRLVTVLPSVPWIMAPKITMLKPNEVNDDTVQIKRDQTIHLRCAGQSELQWSFPNNNLPFMSFEDSSNMTVTVSCSAFDHQCISDVVIYNVQYYMTGYYNCHYSNISTNNTNSSSLPSSPISSSNGQHNLMDSIYIFVNDPENLIVPYDSTKDYFFIAVFQSHPATIPCRPTYLHANVTLWKMHTINNVPEQIKPNASLGITYNPKRGFHFEHARWDAEMNFLECRYSILLENNDNGDGNEGHLLEAISTINIHWSILPEVLHPIIDDSQARHIFINDTFKLRCFVHFDIGALIIVDWDYPNKNSKNKTETNRIFKSEADTSQQLVSNGNMSYETVSINITIVNATIEDQGLYRCIATTAVGKTFSATKRIVIFDEHLSASVTFSTEFDNSKPIISEYDQMVHFIIIANAFPDISFIDLVWYKDGQQLLALNESSNSVLSEIDDGHFNSFVVTTENRTEISFEIEFAKASDSGTYTLFGSTTSSNSSISIQVYIKGDSKIIIENSQEFYVLNRSYHLPCKSYGYPKTLVWWYWSACNSTDSCPLKSHSPTSNDNKQHSYNWNIVTSMNDNFAHSSISSRLNEPYLNVSNLELIAQVSGFFQCSSLLLDGSRKVQHVRIPFIVMDADELFSVTSSTDEPTVNDTIVLTCKASLYNYDKIWWTKQHDEQSNDGHTMSSSINVNDSSTTISNQKNQYSHCSVIVLHSVPLNFSAVYTCNAVSSQDPSKIEKKEFHLNVKNISPPMIIDSNFINKGIMDVTYNSQTELKCYVQGRPRPSIQWYRNGQRLKFDGHDSGLRLYDKQQRLVFTRLLDKDSGLYECRAENRGGVVSRRVLLQVKGNMDNFTLTTSEILFIILCFIMGTVIIVIAFFFGKKFRHEKLNKRELELFSKTLFEQGQMQLYNPEMPLDEQIDLLPYDSRFEFPKERLILGRTIGQGAFGRVVKAEAIGLENDESVSTVAVKMLKERADTNQRKALMAELKILIHLGKHLNIVNLLGAVTKNLAKGELLVIVEYCEFGNLRHYLLANRENFINQLNPLTDKIDRTINSKEHGFNQPIISYQNVDIVPVRINQTTVGSEDYFMANGHNGQDISYVDLMLHRQTLIDSNTISSCDYINTNGSAMANRHNSSVAYFNNNYGLGQNDKKTSTTETRTSSVASNNTANGTFRRTSRPFKRQLSSVSSRRQGRTVTTSDLVCWAFQCARGMDYLTLRKLIHRDLAARNVLLANNNVVKICDFGLAKDVYKYDNYIKKDDGPLPIKWMAIESISDKIFTSKSDVWSYGILLWELFTLGKNPYPGLEIDEEFYKRLKNGYRMEKPDYCSEDLYQLMLQCWNANPNDRPDFADISDIVGQLLDDKTKKLYIEMNNPYLEMNQQILGTNDYLKMTCQNDQPSSNRESMLIGANCMVDNSASDECQYETNISFVAQQQQPSPLAKCFSNDVNDSHENEDNIIEMSILERSLTKTSTIDKKQPLIGNNVMNNIHYDNLTAI